MLFRSDILVSNTQPPSPLAVLFTQNETKPYGDSAWDRGANAGIVKMPQTALEDVLEAPSTGYLSHWFRADVGGVYCVRARDGQHYAKIQITNVESDRIAFDWVFQPSSSPRFR